MKQISKICRQYYTRMENMNQKPQTHSNLKIKREKLQSITILIFFIFFSIGLFPQAENPNIPVRGESLFDLKKLWSIDTADEDPFGNINNILISDKGTICCYDNKNMKYHLFDGKGKFFHSFGSKGEGPGQIRQPEEAPIMKAGDKIVVLDLNRLHYFDWEGNYIRSKVISNNQRPTLFLDENRIIHAPLTILNAPNGIAKVKQINLISGKERVLTEFTMFKGGVLQTDRGSALMWAEGLTPMFILGKIRDKLYYGVNNKYRIFISDMDGKVRGNFGLTRQKTSVSEKEKVDFISKAAQGQAPDNLIRTLAKQLPNEETYFSCIEEHSGLIYVFVSKFIIKNIQSIDIFSPAGKYLYKKSIKIRPSLNMVCMPIIDKGYAYLAIEDEDGEISLNKYEIKLPLL